MSVTLKILTAAMLSLAIVSPALADVTWDFFETSLIGSQAASPTFPAQLASLTVSDADFLKGNVTYSYINNCPGAGCSPPTPTFVISGDTDFVFSTGLADFSGLNLPLSPINTTNSNGNADFFFFGSIGFNFDAAGNIVSGGIGDRTDDSVLAMTVTDNLAQGTAASDSDSLGCHGTGCTYTGYWTLVTPVPEPSSIALFAAAIGVLGFFRRRRAPS
jgi:hypothetical protein